MNIHEGKGSVTLKKFFDSIFFKFQLRNLFLLVISLVGVC